ncbi:MAG: hydrogenase iron-sulfur subunit [Deltaproteobacteria bacterium]|nr:MAG: hydrogenase iron-sulfur subunit [Deltaproteobacteria bacterium]
MGDCHYLEGNKKCEKVVEETWEILKLLGVDPQRLHLKWISASEGAIFAEEIRSFVQLLKELGENSLSIKAPVALASAETS